MIYNDKLHTNTTMANTHVYDIFFNEKNERMATVYNYSLLKEEVIQDPNIYIMNRLNMDIGDYIEFESRYHGWVEARIVRITSAPNCGDEYKMEYTVEGDDTIYYDEVEGQYL